MRAPPPDTAGVIGGDSGRENEEMIDSPKTLFGFPVVNEEGVLSPAPSMQFGDLSFYKVPVENLPAVPPSEWPMENVVFRHRDGVITVDSFPRFVRIDRRWFDPAYVAETLDISRIILKGDLLTIRADNLVATYQIVGLGAPWDYVCERMDEGESKE